MNMNQAVERMKADLTQAIHAAVRKVWPKLVSIELAKLSGGISTSKPRKKTEYRSRDERLADVRKLKAKHPKMTQAEIARKLGLTQGYVSRITRGLKYAKGRWTAAKTKPWVAKLKKVAKKVKRKRTAVTPIKEPSIATPMAEALAKHGSRTDAAAALNIPRQTFSDRLAREQAS